VVARRRFERGQSVVEFALVVPLMLILLMAVVDLSRIYTTMMAVESAAREAADFATSYGAGKWQDGSPLDSTVAAMKVRACVAAGNLPDYEDPEEPNNPSAGTCTNPSFAYCLTATIGGPCGPVDPAAACNDPLRATPCTVTVTLTHVFHLMAPFAIDFYNVHIGLPATLTFDRTSTFAITDIGLAPTPPP
jgi:TadE-like protein